MPVSHAANSGTFAVRTLSDNELVITRLFDAPRDAADSTNRARSGMVRQ